MDEPNNNLRDEIEGFLFSNDQDAKRARELLIAAVDRINVLTYALGEILDFVEQDAHDRYLDGEEADVYANARAMLAKGSA